MQNRCRVVLAAVVAAVSVCLPTMAADRPNLIVLISDDHGQLDCTPYGSTEARTPNMQRLADAGMTFTQGFVASPSCAPSRAAMLTGLMPARNGAENNHTYKRDGIRSLPERLRELGYQTAAFGKVAHGDINRHGFDVHDGKNGAPFVADFLARRDATKPLCMFVGTGHPHVPWPNIEGYDPERVAPPPTHVDTAETRDCRARYLTEVTQADRWLGEMLDAVGKHLDPRSTIIVHTSDHGSQWPFGKWNLYEAGIRVPFIVSWPGVVDPGSRSDAMVQSIDILPTLIDAAGGAVPEGIDGRSFLPVLQGRSTLHRDVVFTTHSGDGRMNVYPIRAIRTPQWKLILNLHPEFAYTTHIDKAASKDGLAYWKSWFEKAKSDPVAAAIVKRYHERPAVELYDLAADPHEMRNVATSPEHAERVRDMRVRIEDWMEEQGDERKLFSKPRLLSDPASTVPRAEANDPGVAADAGRGPRAATPNIIFILADDLGYGDLGCYGATKVSTPNCDRLARDGLRFTDAHAPASVCTPTRYAFLTGEYAWRKKGTGVLPGIAGLIIEPGRTTVASILRQAGYATGVVGKWHLGLGITPTDYNGEIKPGPLEIGFDSAWLLPATGDRTPCVWVEDHRVVNLDPADPIRLDYSVQRGEPRSFVSGIPRIGGQAGGQAALWKDDEIADVIAAKGVEFIEKHRERPFFLYLPTHDIHVPRVPHSRFQGTSGTGVRGDAIHSFDWTVGRIMDALDRLELADDTLVILTSDNGGILDDNGPDTKHGIGSPTANDGHRHNGPLRAGKGSSYEGGSRVPFIVRWPGRIAPGTSAALVSHVDMLASLGELTGQTLAAADAPDSLNVLPALLGEPTGRTHLVEQGPRLALREGTWKYLPPTADSAAKPAQKAAVKKNTKRKQAGKSEPAELYDLATDIGETDNVAARHPEVVDRMHTVLETIQSQGRSRP